MTRKNVLLILVLGLAAISFFGVRAAGKSIAQKRLHDYFQQRAKAGLDAKFPIDPYKVDDDEKSARITGYHYLGGSECYHQAAGDCQLCVVCVRSGGASLREFNAQKIFEITPHG